MTNQQPSEALPITELLEEAKNEYTPFRVLIPKVRQLETEHVANVSRAHSEERERIVGILEEIEGKIKDDGRTFIHHQKKKVLQEAIERINNQ